MNATLGGRMDEAEMEEIINLPNVVILDKILKTPDGKEDPDHLCTKFKKLLTDVYEDEGLTTGRQLLSARFDTGDFSPLTSSAIWDPRLQVIQRVSQAVSGTKTHKDSTKAIDLYLSIGDVDSAYRLIQNLEGEQLTTYKALLNSRLPFLQFSPELHEKIVHGESAHALIKPARMLLVMAYPEKFLNGLPGDQAPPTTGRNAYKVALWNYVFNANIEDQTLKTIIELAKTLSNGTAALLELINHANINFECEAELLAMARAQTSSDTVFTKWVFENMKGRSGGKTVKTKKGAIQTIPVDNTATILGYSPKGARNRHIGKNLATNHQ